MHTQKRYATCFGMSKKKERQKIAPYPKWKKKREMVHTKEVHTPSTKNIHTLAHLDQGLWHVSPLDLVFDLTKYEKQVCLQILYTYSSTKIAIRDRLRNKGTIKSLGKELYTLSDPRDHLRNFIHFFWKTLQNLWIDGRTKEKEIWALYDTVLTLNRQRWAEAKVRGKNKRPTYSKSR